MNVAPRQLPQYICWTRPQPPVKTKIQDQRYPFERENTYKKNFIWIICRFLICSNQSINSWIGFNIITGNSNDLVVNKDTVRYLTKIDAFATSMITVVEILTNAKLIRVALQLESVITFFFFFLSGFSFTNIHDSRDSRGRGRVSFNSSLPLPPASQTLRH